MRLLRLAGQEGAASSSQSDSLTYGTDPGLFGRRLDGEEPAARALCCGDAPPRREAPSHNGGDPGCGEAPSSELWRGEPDKELVLEHLVLEVGPGTGTLTEALLDRGAQVVACELDRDMASILEKVDSLAELEMALVDPSAFFAGLTAGPAAKQDLGQSQSPNAG